MAQQSILIVDDDSEFVQQLSSLLQQEGFTVNGSTHPDEALELYRRFSPDLVLTDLRMPDVSGFSVLKKIRDFDPNAKVVIITAYGEKETVAQAFRMGAAEFIDKPVMVDRLLSTLRTILEHDEQSLQGDLRMMSLASIIQINCEERNQALLTVRRQGREGRIYFNNGEIIHAETGELSGESAIYELLGWEDGTFQLKMGADLPEQTIHKGWSGLLLEGMRRIDESTAGWSTVWDDEFSQQESEKDDLQDRIARALNRIGEVEGAWICTLEGELLGYDGGADPEQIAGLMMNLKERGKLIGDLLAESEPERISVFGTKSKGILIPHSGNLIYLLLVKRASIDAVSQSVNQTLKRYRTA